VWWGRDLEDAPCVRHCKGWDTPDESRLHGRFDTRQSCFDTLSFGQLLSMKSILNH